jgi:Domain of unknown function (DUF4192)
MTTIVKAHNAADFLALVPYLVGFHPRNSVVLVAFSGTRTRSAMRFDLPQTDAALACKRIATTLIGMLCKLPDVDAVVPVAYTDEPFESPGGMPNARFIHAIVHGAERAGFRVRDALCVAADAWGGYLDPDGPGHPLDEIRASDIGQRIPGDLGGILGAVADGAVLPDVDLGTRERVARLLVGYRKAAKGTLADGVELGVLGAAFETGVFGVGGRPPVFAMPALIEIALALDPFQIQDRDAAFLLWFLERPVGRDALMLQFAFGPAAGFRVLFGEAEFRHGDDRSARHSAALLSGEGPRPDPERIALGIEVLKAAVARAPKSASAAPLSALAWLNWALGRGSVAGIFVDRALKADPGYGMAQLIAVMVQSGRLPEWAFSGSLPPAA